MIRRSDKWAQQALKTANGICAMHASTMSTLSAVAMRQRPAAELHGTTAMEICQHARLKRVARRAPERVLAVLNHWLCGPSSDDDAPQAHCNQ